VAGLVHAGVLLDQRQVVQALGFDTLALVQEVFDVLHAHARHAATDEGGR
jgi:hypothetical protein